MEQVQDVVNEIQSTLDEKKTLGVKDRKELVSKLQQVKYNIGCNLDFCADQFNEQMEKTVFEAKEKLRHFVRINFMQLQALL